MNDFRPLGPPLPRDIPEVEVDFPIASTTPGVYKIDGKYQTFIPDNERAHSPIYKRAPPIPADPLPPPPAIDFILAAMERLKDPEFPAKEWGTW